MCYKTKDNIQQTTKHDTSKTDKQQSRRRRKTDEKLLRSFSLSLRSSLNCFSSTLSTPLDSFSLSSVHIFFCSVFPSSNCLITYRHRHHRRSFDYPISPPSISVLYGMSSAVSLRRTLTLYKTCSRYISGGVAGMNRSRRQKKLTTRGKIRLSTILFFNIR